MRTRKFMTNRLLGRKQMVSAATTFEVMNNKVFTQKLPKIYWEMKKGRPKGINSENIIHRGLYFTFEIYLSPSLLSRSYKLPPSAHFRSFSAQFFRLLGRSLMNWDVKYRPLMIFHAYLFFSEPCY